MPGCKEVGFGYTYLNFFHNRQALIDTNTKKDVVMTELELYS